MSLMDVHLIDGTYELFRHFFAVPAAADLDGQEIGAVRGVLHSVLSMVERGATHIGVATDHVVNRFGTCRPLILRNPRGPTDRAALEQAFADKDNNCRHGHRSRKGRAEHGRGLRAFMLASQSGACDASDMRNW